MVFNNRNEFCPTLWQISKFKPNWFFVAKSIPLYGPHNALSVGKKTSNIAPSLWDFAIQPEENGATAIGNMHKKIGKNRACGSGDMQLLSDRQTHRQTC